MGLVLKGGGVFFVDITVEDAAQEAFEGSTLAGEIRPKNRVLPLLRPHFCDRMYNETFLLYDRTHREALVHQKGKWAIPAPGRR